MDVPTFMTKDNLRKVCKRYELILRGNKQEVRERIFTHFHVKKNPDAGWGTVPLDPEGEYRSFPDWMEDNKLRKDWLKAPDVSAALESQTLGRGEGISSQSFSLNEFARLATLLAHNDTCREALVTSCGDQSHAQKDAHVKRDAFWTSVIEPVFNNPLVNPVLDVSEVVADVDASLPPLQKRTGSALNQQYDAVRGCIIKAYKCYAKSGNHDVKNFHDVCLRDSRTGGNLKVMGKKCMIMFKALRTGEKNEVEDLVDFILKTLPSGVAVEVGEDLSPGDGRLSQTRSQKAKQREIEVVGTL